MSKKAQSTGFSWVYGLIMLFGIGIMYITFNQVFVGHLVPVIKAQANTTAIWDLDNGTSVNEINTNIDKYMDFFHTLPFILFFIIVIYMLVSAIRKERESDFG